MKKSFKSCLVLAMVFAFGVTSVQAADQIRKKDRKKDGTCQSYTMESSDMTLVAAKRTRARDGSCNGTPKRDRNRDGSCQTQGYVSEINDEGLTLAAAQKRQRKQDGTGQGIQKRDRKRDGSCLTLTSVIDEGTITLAADRKRDRKRDGSCDGTPKRDRLQKRDGSCLV